MQRFDLQPAFSFLRNLAENNDRSWFEQHKGEYLRAKDAAEVFFQRCIEAFGQSYPLGELSARQSIYRIYRDVRFSKNKNPYKTNFAALIAAGGRKSTSVFAWYLHLEPGNSFLASGNYEPTPEQLASIRQEIVYNAGEFRSILNAKDIGGYFGEIQGKRLKTAPKGFSRDHPEIEFLRLTQLYFMKTYNDAEIQSAAFPQRFSEDAQKLLPFLQFLQRAVE